MARPVAAIIPTRNSRAFVDRCLASLVEQRYPELSITVVDNASTDRTLQHVEDRWPEVRALTAGRNLGYDAAVNLGARQARGDVLALNADTRLARSWCRMFLAVALVSALRLPGALLRDHRPED
jgi:GT2 family glycosyltransferase